LVAEVSMGQVGAVFALEVSRLARSNLDWHRLLELCALTETLVIDEDGCYDPADFNDGLLLGLKGAMAQAELHFLHARLQGGKLNKAKKGELRFPVPVGLCYDEQGRVILDPDEEVQGAVSLVFRLFRETGSAFGVMQRFAESALRFPKRSYGGAWDGKIIWGRLTHSRVLSMTHRTPLRGSGISPVQRGIRCTCARITVCPAAVRDSGRCWSRRGVGPVPVRLGRERQDPTERSALPAQGRRC
jgi:DNA invertase Pin-like site-specific DNA recombinase